MDKFCIWMFIFCTLWTVNKAHAISGASFICCNKDYNFKILNRYLTKCDIDDSNSSEVHNCESLKKKLLRNDNYTILQKCF